MEEIRRHEGKRSIQQSGDDYMTWTKGISREGTGGDRDRLWGETKELFSGMTFFGRVVANTLPGDGYFNEQGKGEQ